MKTLPFGTWPSPITPDAIVAETIRLASITLDSGRIGWLEGRPAEGGRNVLVRTDEAGRAVDVTPTPFNVRSRVHEYGGGAYAVSGDHVWFSNFEDGRVYMQAGTAAPVPLTAAGPARFADLTVDRGRQRLLAVRETHDDGAPPVNDLVAISVDDGSVRTIASGHDFFAAPAPSPDGRRLAWLAWDQPDMPWDAAALWLAELDRDGVPGAPVRIAGGSGRSAFQPAWAPDGALWCVTDPGTDGGTSTAGTMASSVACIGPLASSGSPCGSSARPPSVSTETDAWCARGEAMARGAWAGSNRTAP